MRTKQHYIQAWERSACPDTEDEGHRNNSGLTGILFDPVAGLQQSTGCSSRGSCEPCACVVDLRGAIVIGFGVVKNSFAGVTCNIAHSFSSSLDVFDSLRCSTFRWFAHFLLVSKPFRFGAQTLCAACHGFSAPLCSFAGSPSPFTYHFGDRKLFIELASFSARRLLQLVQLILVVSHPILAM